MEKDFETKLIGKSKFIQFWMRFKQPFSHFSPVYKIANPYQKTALILQLIMPGFGNLFFKQIEKGFLRLVISGLIITYFALVGWQHLFGLLSLDYLSLPLVAAVILVIFLFIYYFAFKDIIETVDRINAKQYVPSSIIATKWKQTIGRINTYWHHFAQTYYQTNQRSKVALSLSFILPGTGHLIRKHLISGIFYLLITSSYFIYFFGFGYQSLKNLLLLNSYVGDRRQPIIFGILALIISITFIIAFIFCQKSILQIVKNSLNDYVLQGPKYELRELNNQKVYRVSLSWPIIGAILFTVIPLLFMILLAFTNYNLAQGIGQERFTWSGLLSFQELFAEGTNLKAFVNVLEWTLIWALFATFTTYFGGLFLALLLQRKTVKIKPLWRSLFVIAMAVPQFVSLRVMYSMFDTYGPINTLLVNWGLISSTNRIDFWGNTLSAKTLIIMVNMWVGIPFNMLLMSGLLINIPQDYYEAAKIEGASRWQVFKKITFPYIWYMTTPVLITGFVHNINNFNVIWLLTQGGPLGGGTGGSAGSTDILITWLYRLTMYNQNVAQYNIGSAIGILMFVISAGVSLWVYQRSAAYKHEEEFQQ